MRAVVPVTVINIIITVSSRKIFFYLFIFSFSTIITVIKRDYSSVGGTRRGYWVQSDHMRKKLRCSYDL